MSHTYTDAAEFDSAITLPDDGDQITAASVNVALEALADRERYLYQFRRYARKHSYCVESIGDTLGQTSLTTWGDIAIVAPTCLVDTYSTANTPTIIPTDRLVVEFSFYAKATASDSFACQIVFRDHVSGDLLDTPSIQVPAFIDVDSAQRRMQYTVRTEDLLDASGIIANDIDVVLQAKALTSNGSTIVLYTPTIATVEIVRKAL